jgi:hypothetical protein
MGAFLYADDIILLSPSVFALNELINVCESFSSEYNIQQCTKSKMVIFGDNCKLVKMMYYLNCRDKLYQRLILNFTLVILLVITLVLKKK